MTSALAAGLTTLRGLDAPCRVHPGEAGVVVTVENWAVARGLVSRATAGQARFGVLASRAFPESSPDVAALSGQWLAWFCASDDERDDGAELGLGVLDRAFEELWAATAPRAGAYWARRFLAEYERYRRSESAELASRRSRRAPALADFEGFRRATVGTFLLLLPEPLLGVELPPAIGYTSQWRTLTEAAADVIAWTNDLASVDRDTSSGDTTSYVLVAAHELGLTRPEAVEWVCGRVAGRMAEMRRAAMDLPAQFEGQGLTRAATHDVSRIAMTLLSAPRAHLEWLIESGRYELT
ncbi:hypothetical protein Lfu02_41150 [Longispora fulva]|uniref:Terpene synthase n=1 Tax=Longispora fulva TaxID=619741 RepID=A0A8J7GPI5_9ACTN|nr:terpene synthase family protein [Longispora fulva]MBG6136574.1 hypothetical protein [Longispora fulva]GIG59743.1 hypothetical protein Lfu02_41150 [Longispora fulva]